MTGLNLPRLAWSPRMKTLQDDNHMVVRIPALDDVLCPRCGAENAGEKIYVWRVADERGPHHECDACAHDWKESGQ